MDDYVSKGGGGNYRLLQVLNIAAFLIMITVNFLANYLPLNGLTTGEVSALYPNLFTPAGFTFSIWGFIYLLLAFFVYIQARGIIGGKSRELSYIKRINYLFFTSCLLNAAWIFAWHYLQVGLSLLIMLLLLYNLIKLYMAVDKAGTGEEPGGKITRTAFSVYLGWITIATVANVTALLVHLNWNQFGLSDVFWMIVVMILSTLIVISFMFKNRDWIYGCVALWAFLGIIYQRLTIEPVFYSVVIITAACMGVITYGVIKVYKC